MNQTGQPLVDAGRAIAAILSHKQSVEQANTNELNHALGLLINNINPDKKNLGPLNRLSILAAFWMNNPLMGKNMEALPIYLAHVKSLLQVNAPTCAGVCQICGSNGIFSDAGRSWMPLAAGANSDPCSLPNLRGKFLCADCFRSVLLLPLGCRFSKAGPYLFHLTDPELQVEAMKVGVGSIQAALLQRKTGNIDLKESTRLSGRLELLEIISGSRLWDSARNGTLSRRSNNGATIISFSNSGTSVAWNQLHLPAQALDFFAGIAEANLRPIFLNWAEKSKDRYYDALCDDLESRRSLAPILAAVVKSRRDKEQQLTTEEKKVLRIYEDEALGKGERFETLERIAKRVNDMEERYRESFRKQLANTRDKRRFLELLTKFAQSEKTNLRLTTDELRILHDAPASEAINLLYLLGLTRLLGAIKWGLFDTLGSLRAPLVFCTHTNSVPFAIADIPGGQRLGSPTRYDCVALVRFSPDIAQPHSTASSPDDTPQSRGLRLRFAFASLRSLSGHSSPRTERLLDRRRGSRTL